MARTLTIILAIALSGIGANILFLADEAQAQQFPSSAVIRGENIRLRLEPAEATEDVAILQRGDEITITGDVTAADGLTFYPVEVVQTDDAGWVRDLFINPKSIVPLEGPAPEPEPEAEPAPDASAEEGNNERRERPARNNRQNRQNREAAAAAEDAAAADQAAEDEATAADAEGAAAEAVATATGVGTARSERFALEPGRYRLTAAMEVSEASGFTCDIFGPDNFTESLFDEQIDAPQSWTAQTRLRLESGGDFYVECSNTDAEWTISFVPA